MKIRPLIIDGEARAKIAHVLSFAEENHYYPDIDPVPGDIRGFWCNLGTYRCVFTYTHFEGKVIRHLSISVPAKNKFPSPEAAFLIAQEFGFTGWDGKTIDKAPEGWEGGINTNEHCIILIQEIKE